MGLLHYLGLDELADGINELTQEFDGLRDDLISAVIDPSNDLKEAVIDSADSLAGEHQDASEET